MIIKNANVEKFYCITLILMKDTGEAKSRVLYRVWSPVFSRTGADSRFGSDRVMLVLLFSLLNFSLQFGFKSNLLGFGSISSWILTFARSARVVLIGEKFRIVWLLKKIVHFTIKENIYVSFLK